MTYSTKRRLGACLRPLQHGLGLTLGSWHVRWLGSKAELSSHRRDEGKHLDDWEVQKSHHRSETQRHESIPPRKYKRYGFNYGFKVVRDGVRPSKARLATIWVYSGSCPARPALECTARSPTPRSLYVTVTNGAGRSNLMLLP